MKNDSIGTLDQFAYNLKLLPPTTVVEEDIQLYATLYKAFQRLPPDIYTDVIQNVHFFAMTDSNLGQYCALYLGPADSEFEAIFLNWSKILECCNEEEQISIIAHEIAHYILKHTSGGEDAEMQADDLITKWGFQRANN